MVAVEGYGLSVTEWLLLEIPAPPTTLRYLTTKRSKLGQVLSGLWLLLPRELRLH